MSLDMWNLRGGQCKYLSEDGIRKIHLSSLKLLEKTGCMFKDRLALGIFEDAGAKVDYKTETVRIPAHLVEQAIKKAPSSVLLAGRDKRYDIILEGNRVYFGTGSVAINVLDLETAKHRRAVKKDVYDFARLVDALEHVNFYKIIVSPSDVPSELIERHMADAAFNGTTKHFSISAYSHEGAKDLIKMGEIVAGAVVLQNAESLAGIVLAQLINPGTPVMRMDKRSGNNFLNHNILLDMLISVFTDRELRTAADRTFSQRDSNIFVNSLRCFSACSRMTERCSSFLWNIARRISFGIKLFKRSLFSLGEVFFKRFLFLGKLADLFFKFGNFTFSKTKKILHLINPLPEIVSFSKHLGIRFSMKIRAGFKERTRLNLCCRKMRIAHSLNSPFLINWTFMSVSSSARSL